jgi:hypothetical protein
MHFPNQSHVDKSISQQPEAGIVNYLGKVGLQFSATHDIPKIFRYDFHISRTRADHGTAKLSAGTGPVAFWECDFGGLFD